MLRKNMLKHRKPLSSTPAAGSAQIFSLNSAEQTSWLNATNVLQSNVSAIAIVIETIHARVVLERDSAHQPGEKLLTFARCEWFLDVHLPKFDDLLSREFEI